MLRSCAKRLEGLAVTTLPGASLSFNPALKVPKKPRWKQSDKSCTHAVYNRNRGAQILKMLRN